MNSILNHLDALKKAQVCDSRIYLIQSDLKDIPAIKQQIKSDLDSQQASLKALEQSVKDLQLKQKTKEGDLAKKEADIKKLDGQLAMVKTNKEYGAIKQEMASLQADNSLIEEEILKSMDAVEAAAREVKAEKARLETVVKDYQKKEQEVTARENSIKSEVEDLKKERDVVVGALPNAVALLYNQIAAHKQGIVLSPVQGNYCGACKTSLRAQTINDVQMGDKMVTCDNCSRILYFEKA